MTIFASASKLVATQKPPRTVGDFVVCGDGINYIRSFRQTDTVDTLGASEERDLRAGGRVFVEIDALDDVAIDGPQDVGVSGGADDIQRLTM